MTLLGFLPEKNGFYSFGMSAMRQLRGGIQLDRLDFPKADTGGLASLRELQRPLDRLEARLAAQWVEELIHLHHVQGVVAHAHGFLKPFKCLSYVARRALLQ